LQDFKTNFNLVASSERRVKYDREVSKSAFKSIVDRCRFVDYAEIEKYYNASLNYHKISHELTL